MNIPIETKPALWGVAGGAVALAIIGFSWGGWVTAGTAETTAVQRAHAAIVEALAPICVDKFQHASDAKATLVALRATDSWNQDSFIEKGGWATFPGSTPNRMVAEACAKILSGGK